MRATLLLSTLLTLLAASPPALSPGRLAPASAAPAAGTAATAPRVAGRLSDAELLDAVQRRTFRYFWDFGHPVSGLARERSNTTREALKW